jgi:Tol biopolymer transport system component
MIGVTVAHYRITSKLGSGGMGEVFRATDSRLNREVALKLLPEHLANDKERMARFHREAQVLASLSHPHIAGIHGLEESGTRTALVMELVEGEDLSERLRRGPIPVVEALGIARQIAEALEAAHDKGVIHRDLKPANVKVTPEGEVKVLDFGLAKALEGNATGLGHDSGAAATLTAVSATRAGTVMGTVAYMSPEQASGSLVDKRSDIWSFGVVLFELLAGRRLFEGETSSHTMADVLRADIDWTRLPASTPGPIRKLLERCLERDRKRRLQAIGEARIIIEDYLANASPSGGRSVAIPAFVAPARANRVAWPVAVVAIVALLGALGLLWRQRGGDPVLALRADLRISDAPLFTDVGSSIELSPDGTRLLFVSGTSQTLQLHMRPLNQLDAAKLVEGNTGATAPYQPFFSPDGQWLGYVTSAELRKVPVSGGTPLTLTKITRSRGASWSEDGTIIFAPNPASGLFRVSAAGGDAQPVTTLDKAKKEATHRWPQVLPGGKAVIFTSHTQSTADFDNATIEVLTLATGERRVLQRGGSYGRYVPSGHLVYVSKATLFAVPLDLSRLEVTGSPAPLVQDMFWNPTEGAAQFTFASTGVLVYLRGGPDEAKYGIASVDRRGGTTKLIEEAGSYANPRLSPDGKRLSLTVLKDGNFDIWVYDLERGVPTRLTFDDAPETEQVWSPDGRFLAFSSGRAGADNLYRKRADGSGEEERLTTSDNPMWPNAWSGDGRSIAISAMGPNGNFDVTMLSLADKKLEPVVNSNFREADPAISPDSRWLAYSSNESGRLEVYVRPYPTGAGRWQVSDNGGAFPRWSGSGRELFYRVDDGLMAASIEAAGDSLRTGKPTRLFTGAFRGGTTGIAIGGNTFADYDVSADGQRFVMFPTSDADSTGRGIVTLVTPWFDELTRTFAAAR